MDESKGISAWAALQSGRSGGGLKKVIEMSEGVAGETFTVAERHQTELEAGETDNDTFLSWW